MTEEEREELIEKMAKAAWPSDAAVIWDACPILLKQKHLNNARAALAVAEPVIREEVEFELRVKNVCVHGTSHPEIYKTAEDDPREELIDRMARAALNNEVDRVGWGKAAENGCAIYFRSARAALAVAEPVIREQCAALAERMGVIDDGYNVADAIREGGKDV